MKEECTAQRTPFESGQAYYDELVGLLVEPKMVADSVKEELAFIRRLQVHLEVLRSYLGERGLKHSGTRWMYTNIADAANPFVQARLVAQENKRVSELTLEDASITFAANLALENLQVHAQSVHDGRQASTRRRESPGIL